MSRAQLRVYHGPESLQARLGEPSEPRAVQVPFGEICQLLADAVQNRRTWLRDFEHDDVTIPTDLYEMLLAYQFSRRPSA